MEKHGDLKLVGIQTLSQHKERDNLSTEFGDL